MASEISCWIRYRSALAAAPTGDTLRVTLDFDAGSGVVRHALEGELRWNASLLALQLCPPDHTYVLHAGTKERAGALVTRAKAAAPCGSAVFEVALDEPAYLARARDLSRVVVALGPKVVVTHGDPGRLVFVSNELSPQSWRRRSIVRAGSMSTATWPTIVGLVDAERSIDVVVTMPPCLSDQESLAAALLDEQQSDALTSFFGTPSWRLLVETQPRRACRLLRGLYAQRLRKELGLRVSDDTRELSDRALAGRPLFASTQEKHAKLWETSSRTLPNAQDEFYLDSA